MADRPKCFTCSIIGMSGGEAGASPGIEVKLGDGNCEACSRKDRELRMELKRKQVVYEGPTVWPGNDSEFSEWSQVLHHMMAEGCDCRQRVVKDMGSTQTITPGVTCDLHRAGTDDQRWLNGLVFMRRRRHRLMYEEGIDEV